MEVLERNDGSWFEGPAGGGRFLTDRYDYDPYGRPEAWSGQKSGGGFLDPAEGLTGDAQSNPARFQGFYFDATFDGYDMYARAYRPDAAQFLSLDRFESARDDFELQADPLTNNRYAFAGNNPVNNIEFDGHFSGNEGGAQRAMQSRRERRRNPESEQQAAARTVTPTEGTELGSRVRTEQNGLPAPPEGQHPQTEAERKMGRNEPPPQVENDLLGPATDLVKGAASFGKDIAKSTVSDAETLRDYFRCRAPAGMPTDCEPPSDVDATVAGAGFLGRGLDKLAKRIGRRLIGKADDVAKARPIGFAPGHARSALENDRRLQHATRHLVDEGVLPAWKGKTSPELFRQKLAPILENPRGAFDDDLRGVPTKVFTGEIDGHDVAIHVFKAGQYEGEIGTAIVPRGAQRSKWGF